MKDVPSPTLAELTASLEISMAQLAAGDLVCAAEILAEEQAALAEFDPKDRPRRRAALSRR